MNKIDTHEAEYDYDLEYVASTGDCIETSTFACAMCPFFNLCEVQGDDDTQ